MESEPKSLLFRIQSIKNGTYIATAIGNSSGSLEMIIRGKHPEAEYDEKGALFYVVAVVFLYGFSVMLLIGTLVKKSKHDQGINSYMKDMESFRRLERREEKFKLLLRNTKLRKLFSSDQSDKEKRSGKKKKKVQSSVSLEPDTNASSSSLRMASTWSNLCSPELYRDEWQGELQTPRQASPSPLNTPRSFPKFLVGGEVPEIHVDLCGMAKKSQEGACSSSDVAVGGATSSLTLGQSLPPIAQTELTSVSSASQLDTVQEIEEEHVEV